jgi:hypothetical protein
VDQLVDRVPGEVIRTLEHETRLVREAIALVASGGASRVTVANLRLSGQLLDPARRLAVDAGVRLVPLWRTDGAGVDIAIERRRDERA